MSNKERLIEFILRLSDEEADLILARLKSEETAKKEKLCERKPFKWERVVYSIKHNVTGREYIGRTVHFDRRIKEHMAALRRGKHPVEDMQADFDKYGEDYTISALAKITDYEQRNQEYELIEQHGSYVRGKGYNYRDTIFFKKMKKEKQC